jgi:hypothetical protein
MFFKAAHEKIIKSVIMLEYEYIMRKMLLCLIEIQYTVRCSSRKEVKCSNSKKMLKTLGGLYKYGRKEILCTSTVCYMSQFVTFIYVYNREFGRREIDERNIIYL